LKSDQKRDKGPTAENLASLRAMLDKTLADEARAYAATRKPPPSTNAIPRRPSETSNEQPTPSSVSAAQTPERQPLLEVPEEVLRKVLS
jgi:hypothetical protein